MILIICTKCIFALRVMPARLGQVESVQELETLVGTKSEFWPNKYLCTQCGARAEGALEDQVVQWIHLDIHDVTPHEAFAAMHGMGLPEEQQCSIERLNTLLREVPIRHVHGKDIRGANYSLVETIELWDGTRVHFGSGADGAVVYRITPPISYTLMTEKALSEAP
jgi:hypothetical protein